MMWQKPKRMQQFNLLKSHYFELEVARLLGNALISRSSQYLLASKSFDVDRLSRLLTSIDLRRTFEPLEPLTDTDIEVL